MIRKNTRIKLKNPLLLLENPSFPSVGPHLCVLGLLGLWHSNPGSRVAKLKQSLLYMTITFFFTQYIKCIKNFNAESLKLILQYAPFHIGVVKSCYFQLNYSKWEQLLNYMCTQECNQLSHRSEHSSIVRDYIKRSRRVTYFFWTLAFFSNFSIFSEPYQKNICNINGTSDYLYIFDGYTPFQKEPPGYYASMAIQTVFGYIMSAYIVGWDMLVVTIMIFFAGQLKISRLNCETIIEEASITRSHENIVACHEFHVKLVKYQKLFNSLISPVMFIYLIVISVNLGVCITQIAKSHNDLATLVSSCVFMADCMIQLLLFYWYSNEVIIQSDQVSYGTFESDWFKADKTLQKEIAILAFTTKKRLAFRAGPIHDMSLATFVAIIRRSYSFYTLLNETQ